MVEKVDEKSRRVKESKSFSSPTKDHFVYQGRLNPAASYETSQNNLLKLGLLAAVEKLRSYCSADHLSNHMRYKPACNWSSPFH